MFKSGEHNNIHNYKPIFLLPLLEKIFKKVAYDKVHMLIFNQLGKQQLGFTPGQSVETNLSELL